MGRDTEQASCDKTFKTINWPSKVSEGNPRWKCFSGTGGEALVYKMFEATFWYMYDRRCKEYSFENVLGASGFETGRLFPNLYIAEYHFAIRYTFWTNYMYEMI